MITSVKAASKPPETITGFFLIIEDFVTHSLRDFMTLLCISKTEETAAGMKRFFCILMECS
jgi:hypothetical protein